MMKRVLQSQMFAPAMRDMPNTATLQSHQLMLRAGYMRQTASGVYTLLPLAMRSMDKIMAVINQEMAGIGAQKLAMPCLTPASLWKRSGRWETAGEELFRIKDRKDADYCLGPTHEEVITDLVASSVTSYRQLPQMLYQMDRKFRDEARPRSGLLRCREFWMKDLYTFDASIEEASLTYTTVCDAYTRIFSRLGLNVIKAEADTGNIGGKMSHEYVLPTDAGDDHLVSCPSCGYAANAEIANAGTSSPGSGVLRFAFHPSSKPTEPGRIMIWDSSRTPSVHKTKWPIESVGEKSVDEIREKLTQTSQSFVIQIDNGVNHKHSDVSKLLDVLEAKNASAHTHQIVNGDFTVAMIGDKCKCGCELTFKKGLELGHAFLLGQRYSVPMQAVFKSQSGKMTPMEMGCYGIGVSRIVAASAEAHHDDKGLALPPQISPYLACIVASTQNASLAEELYDSLHASSALRGELVLDTSDKRLSEKMKIADLMGYPFKIVIGNNANGLDDIEVHTRSNGLKERMTREQFVGTVLKACTTTPSFT